MMTTFILVHGAWHGGWCWEEIVPLLEARGHRVLAPDLPGMGADRTPWAEDVLSQRTDAMAAIVEAQSGPVILVGHSRGGVVVSALTERMPERVALSVYIAAFLLADGENQLDVGVKVEGEVAAAITLDQSEDRLIIDRAKAAPIFYGHADPEVAARAAARLTADSSRFATCRVHLTNERFGRVPRAYVETTDDHAIPLAKQREMQSRWPCHQILTLDSDHSPFYSMSEKLSCILDRLSEEFTIAPPEF